jgi:DNA-binding NarL/FixJ family response regulator
MQPNAARQRVRIVLADDHELLRSGVRALLEGLQGIEIVAEAADGDELIAVAESLEPDVVFTDISMPGRDGLQAIAHLRKTRPGVRCIVLSMHDSIESVKRAVACGAVGYLMKNASAQEVRVAVDTVMSRGQYYSPAIAALLLAPAAPAPHELLTERQVEVLKMLARGLSAKEIAYELDLSSKTVDAHRARIMERLEINDIASLTRYAIRHGLVTA